MQTKSEMRSKNYEKLSPEVESISTAFYYCFNPFFSPPGCCYNMLKLLVFILKTASILILSVIVFGIIAVYLYFYFQLISDVQQKPPTFESVATIMCVVLTCVGGIVFSIMALYQLMMHLKENCLECWHVYDGYENIP
uniref:Uncharacterized protein n=1 Tax=Strigamia maritima TaxID=126957 RepID=T1IHS1_STRMM